MYTFVAWSTRVVSVEIDLILKGIKNTESG